MIKIGKPKIDTYKIVRRTRDTFRDSDGLFAKYNWTDNKWETKIFTEFIEQVYRREVSLDFRAQYD